MIDALGDKPIYTTGTAAEILGISPKTIIGYDREGLINISRTAKNRRKLSKNNLFNIMLVHYFINEQGLTFNGVRLIIKLLRYGRKKGMDCLDVIIDKNKLDQFRAEIEART
jgi:DNA-binding transcriptional MerR regulator